VRDNQTSEDGCFTVRRGGYRVVLIVRPHVPRSFCNNFYRLPISA
jgi:hypothetical protein